MAEQLKPPVPVTASEVVEIVGPLEDAVVASIVATGATAAEVLEAYQWLTADDQLASEIQRRPTGTVAQVYDILSAEVSSADEL